MFKNQKGFTVLEIVLILALIGVIGFAGWNWYVANQESEPAESREEVTDSADEEDEEEVYTVPEGWTEYANSDLGFAFAYPEEWGQVKVSKESMAEDPKSFQGNFSNSDVSFGISAKDHFQKIAEMGVGRGGAMYDRQGFEERNGQLFKVRYDTNAERQVQDELEEGYEKLEGVNIDVVYHDSLPFFSTEMAHLMFNLDDDEYPAMNIYVESSNADALQLPKIANTVRDL